MRALPAILTSLLALLLLAAPAAAQDSPGGGVHAPREAEPELDTPEPEKGPNLQIPVWIGGAAKTRMEAAIKAWEDSYESVKATGARALPQVQEAITLLEEVRPLDPNCALPDYYLGIARQITGEFDDAVDHLKEAIKRSDTFHEAYIELGDACRWAGNDRAAKKNYDKALEIAPDYAHGYYMRTRLLVAQQRYEAARDDAIAALALQPEHGELKALKGKLDLVLDGPDWEEKFEVETRHYMIRTNVSQDLCDELAKHAELIHRLYSGIFPSGRADRKSPIVVFKDRAEYRKNGGPQNAGGHFDPAFKQLFLFNYEKPSDTLLVLYHEGFHQFLDGIMPAHAPQWLNEGLADYFGPSEYVKEGRTEGMRIRPNPWRLSLIQGMIRRNDFLPFERLMNMSQAEMYQPQRASQNYAQAWSMIYFLCEADERAHFKYLKDYFKALRKGKTQPEAFAASFGKADLDAMTERWKEFVGEARQ